MPKQQRVAGTIEFKVNGDLLRAVGDFTLNPGRPKREGMIGATGHDGYKEMPQIPFIEGQIRHTNRTNAIAITELDDETVTCTLANGWVGVLRNAYFAGDGTLHTEEGTMDVRFEGASLDLQRIAGV